VRVRTLVLGFLGTLALALLGTWWWEISFGEALLLAPVIVFSVGAAAGLVVLWTRIALDSMRRRDGRG
jgi:hypothetical protein